MGDTFRTDDWSLEKAEWLLALDELIETGEETRVEELLASLRIAMARKGIAVQGYALNTPYANTIPVHQTPDYPGDEALEDELENMIRWNGQAMVLQAYDKHLDLGGHIATYAAASTMFEVLQNHFLRSKTVDYGGDLLMIQGHASPGLYARSVAEGQLPEQAIKDFRMETIGGVASYPHPRRMPTYWQAPTVSMGLGPMTAVYQARFMRYLENRGLKPLNGGHIWCFVGDGELDEPEVHGSVGLAGRENLNNLTFIIHCNLQRLDGPVRGNGKIIQETERRFLGADWDVIKVVWASEWDEILAADTDGALLERLGAMVDGEFQEIVNLKGAQIRQKIAKGDERITKVLAGLTDDQLENMRRGGHDRKKLYAAFKRSTESSKPTAVIVHTVKGYKMGAAAEGKNGAHQTKNLLPDQRLYTRDQNNIPLTDEEARAAKFYWLAETSPAMKYLHERRQALGGYLPSRTEDAPALPELPMELFEGQILGSASRGGKELSTTSAAVDIMNNLIRKSEVGKYVVPIVPDEAQTFGMEPLFNSAKIYSPVGQLYTPLEIKISVIKYKESKEGQVLQEGINEAGALSSFTTAASAYSTHGLPMIPFYIFYSMFGFQRVADSIWAASDMLCKGFLLGATAGRTTLNGEGLQHEDGHSHLLALTNPAIESYDPAFAYELGVIVQDGIRRMYTDNEKVVYYITVYNENLEMPTMPKGVEAGILKGIYKYQKSKKKVTKDKKAHLLTSGVIMVQTLAAAEILESEGIATDIWSVTSWNNLYRDAEACLRHNLLNPDKKEKTAIIQDAMKGETGVFVAASDWVKLTPGALSKWMPEDFIALGTDGFGLSDSRANLRDYFEISPKYIAYTAMRLLQKQGQVTKKEIETFIKKYGIEGDKIDPMSV